MDIQTLALSIAYTNKIGKKVAKEGFKTQIEINRDILNTVGQEKIFYFLPKQVGNPQNGYDEYIYLESGSWELIGETTVDLSNYYTKSEVDQTIEEKISNIINSITNEEIDQIISEGR